MYNISIEMPMVDWSTVPGARSKGFDCEDGERVKYTCDLIKGQLENLGMDGCFVVTCRDGKEILRERILLTKRA